MKARKDPDYFGNENNTIKPKNLKSMLDFLDFDDDYSELTDFMIDDEDNL